MPGSGKFRAAVIRRHATVLQHGHFGLARLSRH
jgi:hypothetical protein